MYVTSVAPFRIITYASLKSLLSRWNAHGQITSKTSTVIMFKTKVTNDIEFAYHDSGPPPDKSVYDTIILIHGHTYHSGELDCDQPLYFHS